MPMGVAKLISKAFEGRAGFVLAGSVRDDFMHKARPHMT